MVTLSQENEIKMIVDVLQSLHQPTHVIANLCWKPGKEISALFLTYMT